MAKDISGSYSEMNQEWLIGKDIDVIIQEVGEGFYPEWVGLDATNSAIKIASAEKIRKETKERDVFADCDAVKDNRVYLADHFLWKSPIVYVSYLAKWAHPDLFRDLEPEKAYQEYLTNFLKTNINLDDVGIIGYP